MLQKKTAKYVLSLKIERADLVISLEWPLLLCVSLLNVKLLYVLDLFTDFL